MRKYSLNELNNNEFEDLTILICRKVLGEGVTPFATGPDGGRDGKFNGTANNFPSEREPWSGKIVIEAKHTNKYNASCSDTEFKKILKNDVLPKLKRLKEKNKVEYYLLFTNRKLTGKVDEKIEDLLSQNIDIPNFVIGEEKIQQWLKVFPEIIKEARLYELLLPIQFDESDLKILIEAFHNSLHSNNYFDPNRLDLSYIGMETKNQLNKLGQNYFDEVMKSHYNYFDSIRRFLIDPINIKLKDQFDDLIDELNAKISIRRNEFDAFEVLLDELYNFVVINNIEYCNSGKKKLIRVFLNYMYCNCFIGKKSND